MDEDAALTLERKRNYVYCLIVQIMKNEKEMHIDNLVFMVKYGLFCMWPIYIYIYIYIYIHTVGTESIQTPLHFSLFVILQPFAKII